MQSIGSLNKQIKYCRKGNQTMEVLHRLNLELPEGAFLALMGPSGSGKATLLHLIGGLDCTSAGEISVAGEHMISVHGRSGLSGALGMSDLLFQFCNLIAMLSATLNVELLLLLTPVSAAEGKRRVAAALDVVGLSDCATHKPGELSGGQQQRVAIARAIVADPTILVCDRSTGDLDRAMADELLSPLQLLNRTRGKTIGMVTHDQKPANYASRTPQLDKGQLVDSSGLPR